MDNWHDAKRVVDMLLVSFLELKYNSYLEWQVGKARDEIESVSTDYGEVPGHGGFL